MCVVQGSLLFIVSGEINDESNIHLTWQRALSDISPQWVFRGQASASCLHSFIDAIETSFFTFDPFS